jgi:hypothetical protein
MVMGLEIIGIAVGFVPEVAVAIVWALSGRYTTV